MPRRPREAKGGFLYHVLNRRVGRSKLFKGKRDYELFEEVMAEVQELTKTRVLAYNLLPNHWHMVLWPKKDGELSEFLRRVTVTHTQRWHALHSTSGTGPVYQGRFRSFPIQKNEALLDVCRYVEGNAVRRKHAKKAEDWRWSSLWRIINNDKGLEVGVEVPILTKLPVTKPKNWKKLVNDGLDVDTLKVIRECANRGAPYGNAKWVAKTAEELNLQSALRPRGRPRKDAEEE